MVCVMQITIPSIVVTSGLFVYHLMNDTGSTAASTSQWMWLPAIFYAAWNLVGNGIILLINNVVYKERYNVNGEPGKVKKQNKND